MKLWIVAYNRMPTHYNPSHRALVEAESEQDAVDAVAIALGDPNQELYIIASKGEQPQPKARVVKLQMDT